MNLLWLVVEKGWLGYTSTFFFSWSTACVWCLAPNQISFSIIFSFCLTPPLQPPLLPYFSISSKYRQRRLIPHLSVSHSHTNSQVYAGLMRHFACAGKRKKKKEEAHLRVPLKAKHGFWAENSTMDTKVSFKLKGASGSLKMDLHPLLMPSLPCLFCSCRNSMQKGKKRLVQKCFIPVSCLYYCFHPALLGGGWLPLWCQRRVRLPFELSLT